MSNSNANAPPLAVLAAFGCAGSPQPLPGGQSRSYRAGDIVLKPADQPQTTIWAGRALRRLQPHRYRIAPPLLSADGRLVVDGWSATLFVPSQPIHGCWLKKLHAGRAFHHDLQRLNLPPLPPQHDRWSRAHQIVWQESPPPASAADPRLQTLLAQRTPIDAVRQPIHGDLCGNILFADDLPPLIIDFSPAFYATPYAEAILIADAVAWENAPLQLLHDWPLAAQFILRAVLFRLLTVHLWQPANRRRYETEWNAYHPLLHAAGFT